MHLSTTGYKLQGALMLLMTSKRAVVYLRDVLHIYIYIYIYIYTHMCIYIYAHTHPIWGLEVHRTCPGYLRVAGCRYKGCMAVSTRVTGAQYSTGNHHIASINAPHITLCRYSGIILAMFHMTVKST